MNSSNQKVEQLCFPSKVFRGSNALNSLGEFCATRGKRAFIKGGKTAFSKTIDKIHANLAQFGVQVAATEWYGGECSRKNINNLVNQVVNKAADVIIAVGGGKAFDSTVDAIIVAAGLSSIFGGDKLRNAAAHAIYNGFTKIPAAHKVAHGLIVGYCNLCLLALENRSDEEIIKEIRLAEQCSIPTSLDQIVVLSEEELQTVAESSSKAAAMACMPFSVSAEMVIKAMQRVDALAEKQNRSYQE